MKLRCKELRENLDRKIFLKSDQHNREVSHYIFRDVVCVGDNILYPNIRLYSPQRNEAYNPLEERVMSLLSMTQSDDVVLQDQGHYESSVVDPLFFFVYNTDNYYHFIYDALPHIYSFLHMKKEVPNLKLLMSYPNESMTCQYKFVLEILGLLGIEERHVMIAKKKTLYKNIYVSSSYTHGLDSNSPPRKEVYDFLKSIPHDPPRKEMPKKFYVSRRSWVHGDYSNIGTNYTSRRRMVNEDQLVESLKLHNIPEVFTENLDSEEKIQLFKNADLVVGSIGGGMSNLLFSGPKTKAVIIVSPSFLETNYRFSFCFSNVKASYVKNTQHVESDALKKYMRVRTPDNRVGEILNLDQTSATILLSPKRVAGWNIASSSKYEKAVFAKDELTPMDNGLNSEWSADVEEILEAIK